MPATSKHYKTAEEIGAGILASVQAVRDVVAAIADGRLPAGRILLVERLWPITHRVLAIGFDTKILGNTWWSLQSTMTQDQEKALLLWLNSSLALTLYFGRRVVTRSAWMQMKQPPTGNTLRPCIRWYVSSRPSFANQTLYGVPLCAQDQSEHIRESLRASGNAFVRLCSAAENTAKLSGEESGNLMECVAYVSGFVEGMEYESLYASAKTKQLAPEAFCIAAAVDRGHLIRVVLKYIRNNPVVAHQDTGALIMNALGQDSMSEVNGGTDKSRCGLPTSFK